MVYILIMLEFYYIEQYGPGPASSLNSSIKEASEPGSLIRHCLTGSVMKQSDISKAALHMRQVRANRTLSEQAEVNRKAALHMRAKRDEAREVLSGFCCVVCNKPLRGVRRRYCPEHRDSPRLKRYICMWCQKDIHNGGVIDKPPTKWCNAQCQSKYYQAVRDAEAARVTHTCKYCNTEKPLSEFRKVKKTDRGIGIYGIQHKCLSCRREKANNAPSGQPEVKRAYFKRYRDANPKVRVRNNITKRIIYCLKTGRKSKRLERLLGYKIDDLMTHLGSQFRSGMSWCNYGKWHIDHIIPVAAFNCTTTDHPDFRKCWAISNLQPLWAKDNLKKGSKMPDGFQYSLSLGY